MKIWTIFLLILLIGCDKGSDLNSVKIKSNQNFMCNGFIYERKSKNGDLLEKSSREVQYKITLKKWEKEFNSIIGKTIGNIDIKDFDSFPICYESEFQYTFFPSCDVSSYQEKLPNSKHLGLIDKVSGKITYESKYEIEGVLYNKSLILNCKPMNELVIK